MKFINVEISQIWIKLGLYSSQLQTICSFLGLALGIFAIWYARKQLRLSQAQREFELKLQILRSANELGKQIQDNRRRLKDLKNQIFNTQKTTPKDQIFEDNLNTNELIRINEELLQTPDFLANDLINMVSNSKKLSIDSLEFGLKTLAYIENSIRRADTNIEDHINNLREQAPFQKAVNDKSSS